MDPITIITVIAGLAGIISLLYLMFIGQKSLPEYWRQLRESKKNPQALMPEDGDTPSLISGEQQEVVNKPNHIENTVDLSTTLYTEAKRITSLYCSDNGRDLAIGGFSQRVSIISLTSRQAVEVSSHRGIIRNIKIFSSTQAIASCADDGLIQVTYPSTKEFRIVGQHDGPAYCVAFHPSGKMLASAGKDSLAKVWTIEKAPIQKRGSEPRYSEQQPAVFKHKEGTLFAVDFNNTGDLLATAGTKGITFVWNMQNSKPRKLAGFKETVFCVRFDPTGQYLAAGGADGTVRIWNLLTEHCRVLPGHEDSVRWVSFHPSAKLLVSASKDRTLRLWDLTSMQCWVMEGHTDYIYSAEFHPDGKRFFSVSGDGTLREWPLPPTVLNVLELPQ